MEQIILKRRTAKVHEGTIEGDENIYSEKKESVSGPRFFTWDVIQLLLVHSIAGAFLGYCVGFVGPYYIFFEMSRKCPLFMSAETCKSVNHAECRWINDRCAYSVSCYGFSSESQCTLKNCFWNTKTDVCENIVGYTAVENGIFAGALIVGGCIGSLGAASLLSAVGRKRSFLIAGIVACVGAVLTHVSTYNDNYALVIAGRAFAGITTGVLCVASPMYVEEMAPVPYRQVVGVFFQIACTLGILLAAAMAAALNPRDMSNAMSMGVLRQIFCVPSTVLSALVALAGVLMQESPHWPESRGRTVRVVAQEELKSPNAASTRDDQQSPFITLSPESEAAAAAARATHVPLKAMMRPLSTAFVLCIAQQMTGINAIMNYAPNITTVMGLEPLIGNLVVMAWNFVSVLISIPISSKFRADYTYIVAVFASSLSCLLVGIVVFPPVGASETVKRALSSVGIAAFIGVFEIGMGSFFWTLSQNIFPPNFRARGSSLTVLCQFIFNIIINVGFPIAVERLSGGPSGVQDRGMGIAFMFFGCVGALSGLYLLKNLRLWEHGRERGYFERLPEVASN